jgi:hypothetical protein
MTMDSFFMIQKNAGKLKERAMHVSLSHFEGGSSLINKDEFILSGTISEKSMMPWPWVITFMSF